MSCIAQAMSMFPDAKRMLLTAYADTEAAIQAINTARIDYYSLKPWDPPEERLYPILDPACFPGANAMFAAAEELAAAGCTLLQYRNKSGSSRRMLDEARELSEIYIRDSRAHRARLESVLPYIARVVRAC